MGFSKISSPSPTTTDTTSTTPPTVTETQETDTQEDYAQRSARRRGLLSTILSNRNRTAGLGDGNSGGNKTLG